MYTDGLNMAGRTCVVVGAGGGGHGTAITLALLEAGATVAAWDMNATALDELAGTVSGASGASGRIVPMVVDVRDSRQVEAGFDALTKEFGGLHALTNVVGGTRPGQWCGLEDCTDEVFEAVIQTNLTTAFLTCRGAARRMIALGTRGSIVNIASVSGLVSAPEHGPYGAAKSAVMALSRTMAVEWSVHGIRVNVIAPGAMSVPRLEYLHSQQPAIGETIPLAQRGTPFDVASATLFLHSRLAGYITGQVLAVDGGLMAKTPFGGTVVRRMTTPLPSSNLLQELTA